MYSATTGVPTVTIAVAESAQPLALAATRLTVYVPFTVYVLEGFCIVEVFPSPKFQLQVVIVPVLIEEVSVKLAEDELQLVIEVNPTFGEGLIVTACVMFALQP